MTGLRNYLGSRILWLLILAAMTGPLDASEPPADGEVVYTEANENLLPGLVQRPDCMAVRVDLRAQVLWASRARNEMVIQMAHGVLRVKLDLSGWPELLPGRTIHLHGYGAAGQGVLNQALVDNDGLHSLAEKSGTIYLRPGMYPIAVGWFNGEADFGLSVEYAGPGLARTAIPSGALFRRDGSTNEDNNRWQPGLDYRCYQGGWEQLPDWRGWLPVQTGTVSNFDLSVRTRDTEVGLQFDGYLKIDREGLYTFWTKSDDGSRLRVGDEPLQMESDGEVAPPMAREIKPGQKLNPGDDYFWAVTEGVVTARHTGQAGGWQIELSAGRDHLYVEADPQELAPPELFSRVRVMGLCREVPTAEGGYVAGRILVSSPGQIAVLAPGPAGENPLATNVADLRQLAATGQRTGATMCLTGTVTSAASERGFFGFQDDTGGVLIQMKSPGRKVQPGEQLILKGLGILEGNRLFVSNAVLIDNDGVHPRQEKTAAMFLRAGKHPIHVSWFNRVGASTLELFYQGPNLPRQKIPDLALVHPVFDDRKGEMSWEQGIHYLCYEGDWQNTPDTTRFDPIQTGTLENFSVQKLPHPEKVGLEFDGFLDVPLEGEYFFTMASDDGSRLYVDEQPVEVQAKGMSPATAPRAIVPRQVLSPEENNRWAETSGTVTFSYARRGALYLELNSDYGPLNLEVADQTGSSPLLLLDGTVKVQGFVQSGLNPGGQRIAANMFTPGIKQVQLSKIAPAQWQHYPLASIRDARAQVIQPGDEKVVHVRGRVIDDSPTENKVTLQDDTGTIDVAAVLPVSTNWQGMVEALGVLNRSETNVNLHCGVMRELQDTPVVDTNHLPVLTTILQVKQLTREQAQTGYPVHIRGVITLVRNNASGFIIQDDTSAIDVWWPLSANTSLPRVGDYWEVEGKTFAEFAPNITATRATRLGEGTMPEPLHPAWDQLLNGSLDTRYVELQGIVTAVDGDSLLLLTRSGKLHVSLTQMTEDILRPYENALVRIRGCVVPIRNQQSQQVQVGQIRLTSVSLTIDEPAPADPFSAELKNVSELLLFDVRAGSLERVKIAGQVLYTHDHEFFMVDQTNAVRVLVNGDAMPLVGDLVEAVGFPELGEASPVLREAIFRQTGRAPLPAPLPVTGDSLFNRGHDGQPIEVEARLVGQGGDWRSQVLEMQSGDRQFAARLDSRNGTLRGLVPGSLLALTGVCLEQDSAPPSEPQLTSFELWLNSPDGVKVLAAPPWWTLRRALIFTGGLTAIILAGIFWILVLRRRVREHARRLALEVEWRETAQRQSVLEKERSRIAKDMHDQLGASVTRVGLLGELARQNAGDRDKTAAHAEKICQTAFELGRTLDEIVWAVNPKNDSLARFCDYMAVQAQELFQLTPIFCRVDLPPEITNHPLSADVRHNLFLAAKEALNNVARHARAREVWVRFKLAGTMFQISIMDDGGGFTPEPKHGLRNGLQNMQRRMEDVGGSFEITSEPGHGTEVKLTLDLNQVLKKNGPDSRLRA
jgi:signal transduction histidine kinase